MSRTFFLPFSSVGVFKNGRVEIIANDQGNRITPSYVAFTAEGERLIGDAAKNQLTTNPENTVFDAKRLIGRDWSEKTVQKDVKFFPFKVCYTFKFSLDNFYLVFCIEEQGPIKIFYFYVPNFNNVDPLQKKT